MDNLVSALNPNPNIIGPLTDGMYVQLGMGVGFYVPLEAYNLLKRKANDTRQIQFLTVDSAGNPITGSRDECLVRGAGAVAWVTPD